MLSTASASFPPSASHLTVKPEPDESDLLPKGPEVARETQGDALQVLRIWGPGLRRELFARCVGLDMLSFSASARGLGPTAYQHSVEMRKGQQVETWRTTSLDLGAEVRRGTVTDGVGEEEETWKKGSLWGCTRQRCQGGWGTGTGAVICWTRGPLGLRLLYETGDEGKCRREEPALPWARKPKPAVSESQSAPAPQAVARVSSSPPGGGRMEHVSLSRDRPSPRQLATGSLRVA